MTALGTVTAPTLVKEPEGLEVTWTQVADADTFIITMYPKTPKTSSDYDLAEGTVTVTRVAGTGSTSQIVGEPAFALQPGMLYKASIIAHDSTLVKTNSTESSKTTTAVISPGATNAGAGTAGEVAHQTTNPFTGAAFASAGQSKGQVTYARAGDGTITQTTVDATTSEGATAAARDTADLPNGDMQQTAIKNEGDAANVTGGGDVGGGATLLSDLVVTPTSLTANASVVVNPVTGVMTAITGTEDGAKLADGRSVRVDRLLHEIDHTKSTVSKTGVAS